MSFTYRENQNTPLTWAQLDGNFREVESVQRDVLNQVEVAKGAAESAASSSTASQLSAELAEEMARISVVRWCGNSTTPPITRLDGSPLEISDEYGNLTDNLRYNWTGSAWIALNSSAQQLEERLADTSDPSKGIGMLGYNKGTMADYLGIVRDTLRDTRRKIINNDARLADYQADFLRNRFRLIGQNIDVNEAVPQGFADRAANGSLFIQRATTNLVTNATFSGAVVGPYNAGGVFPTGWDRSASFPWEIISVTPSKLRLRVYRTAGAPTGNNIAIRFTRTLGSAPVRGGIVASAELALVSATNLSNWILQVNNNTAGGSGSDRGPAAGAASKFCKAYVTSVATDSVTFRVHLTFGSDTADFEAVVDINFPQLEDGSSSVDYTSFVSGSRTSSTRIAIPDGSHSLFMQSSIGGSWHDITAVAGGGWEPQAPTVGRQMVERVVAFDQQADAREKSQISDTLISPALFSMVYSPGASFTENGYTWSLQGSASAASYAYLRSVNKQAIQRFEVHQGDKAGFDTGPIERVEASAGAVVPPGADIWIAFSLMVENGAEFSAAWCSFIQFHGAPGVGDPHKASWPPCFSMELRGSEFILTTRSEESLYPGSGSPIEFIRYSDKFFERGVFHDIVLRLRFARTGNGLLQAWMDGQVMFDAAIPMGYNDVNGPYMKYGIYRATNPASLAVQFANLEISGGSLSSRVAMPKVIA